MISYSQDTTGLVTFAVRLDFSSIMAVLLGLVLFGVMYNMAVEYLITHKYVEGYMSLVVAGGVSATLIGLAALSWQLSVMTLLGFAASGIPMMIGSIVRYMRMRSLDQRSMIEELQRKSQKNYPHGIVLQYPDELDLYVEQRR